MKLYRFQVVYQEKRAVTIGEATALGAEVDADGMAAVGNVEIRFLDAAHEEDVRYIFQRFHIMHVLQRGVVIDRDQSVYDREEAAEYLRVSASHIDTLMKTNVLPKSVKGFPMFHRTHLDAVWKARMQYDEPSVKRAA